MRGRKPTLRAIDGGLTKPPRSPSWLPEEGQAEWRRVVPGLVARGVLTADDMATVESYCLAVATMRRAQATLAAEGDTIATKDGVKRHPALTTMTQMMSETRRLAAELGLTPASRSKTARKAESFDAWSGLVAG